MEDDGDLRVLDRGGDEGEEGDTELVCKRPERCGDDELWDGGREESWVVVVGMTGDEGEGDDYAEEEPGDERGERDERVQANQTWIRTCKRTFGKARLGEHNGIAHQRSTPGPRDPTRPPPRRPRAK